MHEAWELFIKGLLPPDLPHFFLSLPRILNDLQAFQILPETSDLLENLLEKPDYLLFSAFSAFLAVVMAYVSGQARHRIELLSTIPAGEAPLTLHICMRLFSLRRRVYWFSIHVCTISNPCMQKKERGEGMHALRVT